MASVCDSEIVVSGHESRGGTRCRTRSAQRQRYRPGCRRELLVQDSPKSTDTIAREPRRRAGLGGARGLIRPTRGSSSTARNDSAGCCTGVVYEGRNPIGCLRAALRRVEGAGRPARSKTVGSHTGASICARDPLIWCYRRLGPSRTRARRGRRASPEAAARTCSSWQATRAPRYEVTQCHLERRTMTSTLRP